MSVLSVSSPERVGVSPRRIAVAVGLLLVGVLLLRTAWVNDDAYITFRTIDNFLHGYGLRWNVAERVQTYTHPLWMLLMTAAVWLSGEFYYTAIVVSILLTLIATALALRIARSIPLTVVALSVLLLSTAFIEYSTSGLEHPLSYLLLAAFFAEYLAHDGPARIGRLTLLAALLLVNRIDSGLLVLPALASAVWRTGIRRSIRPVVLGSLPLVAWEVFSVLYYGFAVPNTAFAKLATAIPKSESLLQGGIYLLDVLGNDPVSVLAVCAAVLIPVISGGSWPLAAGIGLYVIYIVWIGGDFMGGRFMADPVFCAAIQLGIQERHGAGLPWALALTVLWGSALGAVRPAITTGADFGTDIPAVAALKANGVNEERRYYYPFTGLLRDVRGVRMPAHRWRWLGEEAAEEVRRGAPRVRRTDAAGFIGFGAGPGVHYVDRWALGDPLLARLPAERPWRVGHYVRRIPNGYLETLESGRNVIEDPGLAAYYDKLRIVTRGPLWSRERLATIVALNLGRYEHYLRSARRLE